MSAVNLEALRALVPLANRDGEFQMRAANWTGSIFLGEDDHVYRIEVVDGRLLGIEDAPEIKQNSSQDVAVSATSEEWARFLRPIPPPGFTHLFGVSPGGIGAEFDFMDAPRYLAIKRFGELIRHVVNGSDSSPQTIVADHRVGDIDQAVGRYIHLNLAGLDHRVYFEEAGQGIGLLCQHTAGTDGRQWRHLLEDPRVTSRFRVIAHDLPYHGKSLPPEGRAWWAEPYELTREFAMDCNRSLARALGLERPVFIGSSAGGMLALDLARYYPDDFRAVIACEGALKVPTGAAHRANLGANERSDPALAGARMVQFMSPSGPERYRNEIRHQYEQGAPGVHAGDINYHRFDHDLSSESDLIDTSRCAVYMLTGEYDVNMANGPSPDAAKAIAGARYEEMSGLGHFPMSEDPERFLEYLLPILDEIASA